MIQSTINTLNKLLERESKHKQLRLTAEEKKAIEDAINVLNKDFSKVDNWRVE